MALLVNENALTPVQNTLLKFLGDAFGLGNERLDVLFRTAYGQTMPQLPRLDKPKWWERQPADSLKRWDARSVSRQHRDIQYRIKLGLPLGGKLNESAVLDCFNRAALRCDPGNFDLLSPREQALAERQLAKFDMATQSLLQELA
jgi:hypothetical protein